MTVTSIPRSRYPVVGTYETLVAQMRAAADKHLSDCSPEERQAWAVKTVDTYLRRGLLVIGEDQP